MPSIKFPTLALICCSIVAFACTNEDAGTSRDDTSREITNEDLSRMVLGVTAFGPEYKVFAPDAEESGIQNIDAAASGDFDPAAEKADLQNAGFVSGFDSYFEAVDGNVKGVFYLGSQVGLFQTKEGAAAYVADSRAELTEDHGRTSGNVTLKDIRPYEIQVADEAAGANIIASAQSEDGSTNDYWLTSVIFRRGRLLGAVGVFAIGASDTEKRRLEGKVKSLAGTMNERMGPVLAASIAPSPETPAPQ